MVTSFIANNILFTTLVICFSFVVFFKFLIFLLSFKFSIDKLTFSFPLSMLVTYIVAATFCPNFHFRQIVYFIFSFIWTNRLLTHIILRICFDKYDSRFDSIRDNWRKRLNFLIVQTFQEICYGIPLIFVLTKGLKEASKISFFDVIGFSFSIFGILMTAISDAQLFSFKRKFKAQNLICNSGAWSLSRHPNYFGEIIYIIGTLFLLVSDLKKFEYLLILLHVTNVFILLFVTGVKPIERFGFKN